MKIITRRSLNFETLTSKPAASTLVALHGLLASRRYFKKFSSHIEGKYKVIGIDLLGFGKSPKPESTYSLDDHSNSIEIAINSLGLADSFMLVGHSLGAVVGLRYVVKHPSKIKRLIMIGAPIHSTEKEGYDILKNASKTNSFMLTNSKGESVHRFLYETTSIARWLTLLIAWVRDIDPVVAYDIDNHTYESFTKSILGIIDRPGGIAKDIKSALKNGTSVAFIYGDKDSWINEKARTQLDELEKRGLHVYKLHGDHQLLQTQPSRIADIIRSLS